MNPSKPALIATFIGNQSLIPLINHLARPKIEGGFGLKQEVNDEVGNDEWVNDKDNTFIITLSHPELLDVTLMQLVINPGSEAPDAWVRATRRLERAMRDLPKESEEAWLGMTLIYQAVVPPNTDLDATLTELLVHFKLHASSYELYLRPLASSEVLGGKLWLLSSAIQDKRNVYVALGTEAEQATLTYDVLFDKDAALLWADTVAHKAYSMLRDYGPQAERHVYRETNKALTSQVQAILAKNLLPAPANPNTQQATTPNVLATLNDFSSKAAKFANATVALQQLQSDLEIHRFNLKLAAQHFATQAHITSLDDPASKAPPSNPITTYHQEQLDRHLFRIRQDLATAKATQDAINTAINYLRAIEEHEQTKLAKRQEEHHHRLEQLIAAFGLVIGLGQIVELYWIIELIVIVGVGLWWWHKRRPT